MELSSIQALLQEAIQEFNEQNDLSIETAPETRLFGRGSQLDSLGLVNFIVMLEEKIADQMDVMITLADERAMSQQRSPFRTVGSLAEYIQMLIEEQQNA